MKQVKRTLTLLAFAFAFMLIAKPISAEAAAPKLNKSKVTIIVGNGKLLKVKNNKKKVKWSSSAKKIASVDKTGYVSGQKEGKAVITAKVGTKKLTCKVTVKEKPQLIKKETICVGGKSYLTVTGTAKKVTWKSSKPTIVKVNKKGVITGKKVGKATITAKVGKKTLKCKVTVKKAVSVDQTSLNIENGGVISAEYFSNYISATSADTSIAKVSVIDMGTGEASVLVYGVKDGTTTVTIANDCNKEVVKVTVTVKKPESVGIQQLIDYLIQNGEVGEEGFIGFMVEDEELMVGTAVLYDASTDTISLADVAGTETEVSVIALALDYHTKEAAVTLMDMNAESFDMNMYIAEIPDYSTYDGADLEFIDLWMLESIDSEKQVSVNKQMRELLVKLESFVVDKTGFTFSDIGLANFSQAE